jgi:hypothetical protein
MGISGLTWRKLVREVRYAMVLDMIMSIYDQWMCITLGQRSTYVLNLILELSYFVHMREFL